MQKNIYMGKDQVPKFFVYEVEIDFIWLRGNTISRDIFEKSIFRKEIVLFWSKEILRVVGENPDIKYKTRCVRRGIKKSHESVELHECYSFPLDK
jgi:hypothetical protein